MNKTTATEINKKFVNLPEDLQRYIFEFKQPNIYIEDIDKEILEKKNLFYYWKDIYNKKRIECGYIEGDYIDDPYLIQYEELILKNNFWNYFNKYQINPDRVPIYGKETLKDQKNNKDLKRFNSLKNDDIFLQFDIDEQEFYCYKVIKRTDCYIHYKRIIRVRYNKYYSPEYFLNIDNFQLEDKIYKKMDSKVGVFIIKKNGFY